MNLKSLIGTASGIALSTAAVFAAPTLTTTEPAPSASIPALTCAVRVKGLMNSPSRSHCRAMSPFLGISITGLRGSLVAVLTNPNLDGRIN